jgi:DNA-binding XRE family transcriptional regulator
MVAVPFYHTSVQTRKLNSGDRLGEPQTFGDHLKKKRLHLGLTQKQVAQALGMSEYSIICWETGKASPNIRYMPRIIAFIGYQPYTDISEKSLGEKILILRQLRGISQKELAQ